MIRLEGAQNALENTWGNRLNFVTPDIRKEGATIHLSLNNWNVTINAFDEIVLTLLVKFLFIPEWLVEQCYSKRFLEETGAKQRTDGWVKVGLVYRQPSVTGIYIRPTNSLFKLFGMDPYPYCDIPYNTLTHTICEEKAMFDIMAGMGPIHQREKNLLPRVSELGFEGPQEGTNVLSESDFRNPSLFKPGYMETMEEEIRQGMESKESITAELQDFRKFTLVKRINNTGNPRKDYILHIPDMVVVLPRDQGKPQSIAVEVELTNKRCKNYEETMNRYKNNNKFGKVYWLVSAADTASALRSAYKNVGGTGTCQTILSEFVVPHPEGF